MDESPTPSPDPEGSRDPEDQEAPVPNRLSDLAEPSDGSDEPDEDLATVFKPGLDPETLSFGVDKPASSVCQWCNALLDDPTVSTCPHCGAALQPVEPDVEVPGLTTMAPEALAAQARVERRLLEASQARSLGRTLLAGGAAPPASPVADLLPSEDEAIQAGSFQPPAPAVQDVIRRMEMEALLARQNIERPVSEELASGGEGEPAAGEPGAGEPGSGEAAAGIESNVPVGTAVPDEASETSPPGAEAERAAGDDEPA
jgi:hypothetical protein